MNAKQMRHDAFVYAHEKSDAEIPPISDRLMEAGFLTPVYDDIVIYRPGSETFSLIFSKTQTLVYVGDYSRSIGLSCGWHFQLLLGSLTAYGISFQTAALKLHDNARMSSFPAYRDVTEQLFLAVGRIDGLDPAE